MKTIIAGSRWIDDPKLLQSAIEESGFLITTVISGGATGVDTMGEDYARANDIPCEVMPANWAKYGRRAGILRNEQMADEAEAVIAVYDGTSSGTAHMISTAEARGLHLFVKELTADEIINLRAEQERRRKERNRGLVQDI